MLSYWMKLVRQANCLSLQKLADKWSASGTVITRATLSKDETGKLVPGTAMLTVLARELGVTTDYFSLPD